MVKFASKILYKWLKCKERRTSCVAYGNGMWYLLISAPKTKQAGIKDSVASTTPEKTDEDGSKAPGVDFYLDQIRQLERRADILRTHAGELKAEVDVLLTELTQSDDEKRVTLRLLKAEFEQKINENANLRERIYGTYAMHRLQATKWEARQQELELQKELTVKRITEEIHSLTEQLNALEDFREKREILLLQYGELESTLQMLISDHAVALETLAQKDGAYRRRLKKNAALEVNKAASVSRELSLRRTQPTYKRILADNVSTESCLTKFVNEVDAMTKENKALHENIEKLKIQRCTLLREQESLASKSSAVAKITHLLTLQQRNLNNLLRKGGAQNSRGASLQPECQTVKGEDEDLLEMIRILKKKLRRKREYSNYLEEVYNSNRKWASKTVNCLSEIHKLVLFLLSDRPGSMVEKKSVNCTPEVIQLILTHLTSILEESNEHDFQTREKIIPSRKSIGDDRDSSKYNSETDESSGISQPHSSRAEDSELEISEPEMDSNDKRKRSFPCQSQRAASSISLRTKNHTTMPCSSLSPQKFPELWDVMAGPKLQQFSPHSRRWCGALEKLRALLHTPSRKSYSSDTRYRIKPGDLKIIPSPSSIIPTNTAKMDTLRRCQTKLPHILPTSVAETQPAEHVSIQTEPPVTSNSATPVGYNGVSF